MSENQRLNNAEIDDNKDLLKKNSNDELEEWLKIEQNRLETQQNEKSYFIKTLFKSENLYIFLLPVIAYFLTYAYSFGRSFFFELPLWMITIELRNIIVTSVVLLFAIAVIIFTFTSTFFEKIMNEIVVKWIKYKPDQVENLIKEEHKKGLQEKTSSDFTDKLRFQFFNHLLVAFFIVFASLICALYGFIYPHYDRKYTCIGEENEVIVDRYQDYLIKKSFDTKTGKMERNFTVFKIKEDSEMRLRPCYIYPTLN